MNSNREANIIGASWKTKKKMREIVISIIGTCLVIDVSKAFLFYSTLCVVYF